MEAADAEDSVDDDEPPESVLVLGDTKVGPSQPSVAADLGVCLGPAISCDLFARKTRAKKGLTLLYVEVGEPAVLFPKSVVYREPGRGDAAIVTRLCRGVCVSVRLLFVLNLAGCYGKARSDMDFGVEVGKYFRSSLT